MSVFDDILSEEYEGNDRVQCAEALVHGKAFLSNNELPEPEYAGFSADNGLYMRWKTESYTFQAVSFFDGFVQAALHFGPDFKDRARSTTKDPLGFEQLITFFKGVLHAN